MRTSRGARAGGCRASKCPAEVAMRTDVGHKRSLGAVVVGTTYGVITHVRALRRAGITVLGLVGRDADKTKSRAERMGVPNAFTNLDQALDLASVEIFAVATPPRTHAPIALAAIAAGKHVLCEKPFALDATEARAMLDAAEAAGVVHLLGTEFRFTTTQTALPRESSLPASSAKTRCAIFVRFLPSLIDSSIELPTWWESATEGGGWLGAAGSHLIDQVRYSIGEFRALSVSLDRLSPRPAMTADDTYTLHFRPRERLHRDAARFLCRHRSIAHRHEGRRHSRVGVGGARQRTEERGSVV